MRDYYNFVITQKSLSARFYSGDVFEYMDGTYLRIGDITKWCQQNIKESWKGLWINDNSDYLIMIFDKESATAFKLKWI